MSTFSLLVVAVRDQEEDRGLVESLDQAPGLKDGGGVVGGKI